MTIHTYAKRYVENDLGVTYDPGQLAIFEDQSAADEAASRGDVVKIDDSLINEYETKINNKWDEYKAKIKAIQESQDPAMLIPQKKEFEIAQIKEVREKEIRLLRREYELKRVELLEAAKPEQLMAHTKYSAADTELAKSFVERFELDSMVDYAEAKNVLDETIELLDVEALAAMKPFVSRIAAVIKENEDNKIAGGKVNSLINELKYSDPVPVYDVIEMFPGAETIGVKVMQGKAIEQSRLRHGTVQTELQRPSERYVAETYGDVSKNTADVGGNSRL